MASATADVLLLVDIQNDFCKNGSLEVPGSLEILPPVNRYIAEAQNKGWLIAASRDWHPVDHCSFEHMGGPWPVHCVQDTPGADFHPDMELPGDAIRISKGTAFDYDQYSAFDRTGFGGFLRDRGIKRVQIAGLALDVCVQASVKDALKEGFEVTLFANATRAVDGDQAEQVLTKLAGKGARIVR
ncbi:MAG: isochorismatase family protein [Oleiphilaceae bacterium]|nr:isochorismatase family protein [Oleiphilaceae bacterium]